MIRDAEFKLGRGHCAGFSSRPPSRGGCVYPRPVTGLGIGVLNADEFEGMPKQCFWIERIADILGAGWGSCEKKARGGCGKI